jgi:ABC-type multidrug transport system fused ATPase/permease subunit
MLKSVYQSFLLLPERARTRYIWVLLSVLMVNTLDLIAIFILGSIVSLIPQFRANNFTQPDTVLNRVEIAGLNFEASNRILLIGIIAVLVIFICRTYFSLLISRRIFIFLGIQQARVSADLLRKIQNVKYNWLQKQDWQKLIYVVTDGPNASIVGVLGQTANLFSELTLTLLIVIFLLTVNFTWTLILVLFAAMLVIILNQILAVRSVRLGQSISNSSIQTRRNASDVISLFQELRLTNTQEFFLNKFVVNKVEGATAYGRSTWIQQFPKYVFEMLITAAALILLILAIQTDIDGRIYLIFLIAITRVLPALARINTLIISIKSSIGSSLLVFRTVDELNQHGRSEPKNTVVTSPRVVNKGPSYLKVSDLCFQYEDGKNLLHDISLEIKPGTMSALIGPSGAGKSTLIELITGFYEANRGEITLDGQAISDFIDTNPGRIAYVSQNPYFLTGSILENVALGVSPQEVDLHFVTSLLEKAGANQFIDALPEGVHTQLSEGGARFSGGQLQRIALARALYTNPTFLILDEATSALDGKTEELIISTLENLKTTTSILIIAHRFATIEFAEQVHLLLDGRIVDQGRWQEISSRNADILSRIDLQK